MAGEKGRSGGARPNTGGVRPGAGRKPRPPRAADPNEINEPLAFLIAVMRGDIKPSPEQLKAATAAAQYVHAKQGDSGKKQDRAEAAKTAVVGKFASSASPLKLVPRK